MSKKTIPFPAAVMMPSLTSVPQKRSLSERRAVEDWINDKDDAALLTRAIEPTAARLPRGDRRGDLALVLAEDANWLELLSFTLIMPSLATWYWISRATQRAVAQLIG
jgi:hypothetical protein